MAYSVIVLTHDESSSDMTGLIQADAAANRSLGANKLTNYFAAVGGGVRKATVLVGVNAVRATGTFTLVSTAAADTAVINGVTFTADTDFSVAGSDSADATALAAAINASANALISGVVTASANSNVVTITAVKPGKLGNCITLSATGGVTASGARATGGTAGTEITHNFGT